MGHINMQANEAVHRLANEAIHRSLEQVWIDNFYVFLCEIVFVEEDIPQFI
jgi:hypothetical protein